MDFFIDCFVQLVFNASFELKGMAVGCCASAALIDSFPPRLGIQSLEDYQTPDDSPLATRPFHVIFL